MEIKQAVKPDEGDLNRDDYQATYCPEDDKLRLYTGRVERSTYEWLRALGFTSTPKQDCDFVAVWTPAREDAALAMIADGDDIGDEDQGPEDRAADRAERFSMYREKRRAEAGGFANRYEAGPDAYGNQNAERAERQAARRDRIGARACSQWSKAEYWQHRTQGVISHALHVYGAKVRRGRILRLEAELRRHLSGVEKAQKMFDAWERVATLPGADAVFTWNNEGKASSDSKALKLAYQLANYGGDWHDYAHPRTGAKGGLYSHLTNRADPITAREAATLALAGRKRPIAGRWGAHYELRLAYERQMLAAQGGSAGDVEMEPGGMLGKYLIVKVNKSATTGAVVSVNVHVPRVEGDCYDYRRRGETMLINIQRMGEHVYTAPTDESLGKLAEFRRDEKAKTKAANAGKPSLINPTNEDAERLQAELNRVAYEKRTKGPDRYMTAPKMWPTKVAYLTQAQYSELSKGTYARHKAEPLYSGPEVGPIGYDRRQKAQVVCKLRIGPRQDFTVPDTPGMCRVVGYSEAPAVIVITDKPQKPLPDWSPVETEQVEK